MIQKKICMFGSFAVGKTSLVRRFVDSLFSEKYHTTVGVKIDKKLLTVNDTEMMLMLWDMAGEDEFCKLNPSFLRGSAGFILVVDGTRAATLDRALEIERKAAIHMGDVPFVMVLNKHDLVEHWEIDESVVQAQADKGWTIIRTSARTGEAVEQMFTSLAEKMLADTK